MLIRRETQTDVEVVDAIHRAAFPGPVEADLVHALRADAGYVPALALVAEDADGEVVGHVICTVGSVGRDESTTWEWTVALGLGPIGVRPDLRASGLARSLYERFFAAMRASGAVRVDAITGPGNVGSQRFHRAMGFEPTGDTEIRVRQAEELREASGAQDLTFELVRGATHYLHGHRREVLDRIVDWLRERVG